MCMYVCLTMDLVLAAPLPPPWPNPTPWEGAPGFSLWGFLTVSSMLVRHNVCIMYVWYVWYGWYVCMECMYVPENNAGGLGGGGERVQLVGGRLPHTRLEGIADAYACMYASRNAVLYGSMLTGPSFITSTPIQRPSSPTAVACSLRSLKWHIHCMW